MDTLSRYEYQGHPLQISAVDESWPIAAAPGLGTGAGPVREGVTLGPIALSAARIAPGDSLTIAAQVGGPDVAFVYLELLLRDRAVEQYYGPVYSEPLSAPRTKAVGGVAYPDWSEAPMAQVKLPLAQRLLTDGQDWALGYLKPVVPRGGAAEVTYTLEAQHRSGWIGRPRRAQLEFSGAGQAIQALSFRELGTGAAPRPFNPRRGDRFIPLLRLYRPAGEAGAVVEKAIVRGNLLKWRQGLQWQSAPLIPGAYLVGLVAEDLDGQLHRRYAPLEVGDRI